MANDLVPATMADPLYGIERRWTFANKIANTEFVPETFRRRPDAVLAAIEFGHEIGIGPMQALQSIDVIKGKPTLKPEAMRARIHAAGHVLETIEYSNEVVTLHGMRRDTGVEETVSFTMQDAETAGLAGKDNYGKWPRPMLLARCTSEISRLMFSDVISGISYTPGEFGGAEPGIENPPENPQYIENADVPDLPPFNPATDAEMIADAEVTAIETYCRRPDCGHMASIHTATGCTGIRVRGVPNTEGSDWPCDCLGFVADPEVISDPHSVSTSEASDEGEGSPIDGSDPATPAVELASPEASPEPEPPLTPSLADTAVSATRVHDLRVRIGALQAKRTKGVNVFVPRVKNGMPLSEYADIEAKIAALEGAEHPMKRADWKMALDACALDTLECAIDCCDILVDREPVDTDYNRGFIDGVTVVKSVLTAQAKKLRVPA